MALSPNHRIYRLKLIIAALLAFILGIAFLILDRIITNSESRSWLTFWPLEELGQTMATAGLFGLAWEYFDSRDRDAREDERIRRLLRESAPDFRDAVIRGFAIENADLKRIATPELLDSLAANGKPLSY
jgi:hypothetical protein